MNLNPLDINHFYILSIHNKYVQLGILMSGFLEPKSFSIMSRGFFNQGRVDA